MIQIRTADQHYVPRFYLERFVDPSTGKVWTCDPSSDTWRCAVPRETAFETNLYSVKDADGVYNDAIEEKLAEIEGKAAPLFDKLQHDGRLLGQERADFAVFLATLYTRSPRLIRQAARLYGEFVHRLTMFSMRTRSDFDRGMDQLDEQRGTTTAADKRDEIFAFMHNPSAYTISVPQDLGLPVIGAADEIASILFRMNWLVVRCPEQHFITCDAPVVDVPPPGNHGPLGSGGFLNKRTFVTFPLSPTVALEMLGRPEAEGQRIKVGREKGRMLNRHRAGSAHRFVYSSRFGSGIMALAKKYAGYGLEMELLPKRAMPPVVVRRQR